ncbi:MAG: peroxidase-related enzyme [Hyphomicrobiales bacterium]
MPFLKSLPDKATVPDILKLNRDAGLLLADYHTAVMRQPSALTDGERELIAAYVSGLNACQYCHGVHRRTAEAYDFDAGLIEALMDDVDAADVDPRLKPVLRYVMKLTRTPAKMTEADADAVFAAGWDDQALHDAINVACLFNFMNRLLEGHGVKGEAAVFEARGPMLKQHGYAMVRTALDDQAG